MSHNSVQECRSAIYVDMENIVGGSASDATLVRVAWEVLTRYAVRINPGDHIVVGSGPKLARVAWFALPATGIRRIVGYGVDGADRALIGDVDLDMLARRYNRLVIVSGDGAFAELATSARSRGLAVTLVTFRNAASQALVRACPTKVWLPGLETLRSTAAALTAVDPLDTARDGVRTSRARRAQRPAGSAGLAA